MIAGILFVVGILMVALGDVYIATHPVGNNDTFMHILLAGQISVAASIFYFLYHTIRK